MINILCSVLLFAVIKGLFTWAFVPNEQSHRQVSTKFQEPLIEVLVRENHDGRDIESPLRFDLAVSRGLVPRRILGSAYDLSVPERFMGGQ
jgi:hypothetical protein